MNAPSTGIDPIIIVFFVYGLAFYTMGLALALEIGGRIGDLEVHRAMKALALFGILHGLHEWYEMFLKIEAQVYRLAPSRAVEVLRVVLLAVSFAALCVSGCRLLCSGQRPFFRRVALLVFILFAAGMGAIVARLAPRAEMCTIDPNPPADFAGHACDHLLNELSSWPTVRQATEQMVRSLNQRGLPRVKPGACTVCIHPGSGSPAKCWPLDRFAELGHRLVASGRRVGFVLGEAELERFGREQIDLLRSIAPVFRPADYLELLGVLGESAVYIGNDSGPSHLAGVIALPAVCLFGPTKPEVWRPLGPRVQVLHRQPLDGLTVDEVLAALPA